MAERLERIDFQKEAKKMRKYFRPRIRAAEAGMSFEKWRHHKMRKALTYVALGLSYVSLMGASNVEDNQEIAMTLNTTVTYEQPALHPDDNDTEIVFMDGFGTDNGDNLVRSLGDIRHIHDGELLSVGYGSRLEASEMAEEIADEVTLRHKDKAILVGYSAGGSKAIDVADELMHNSDIQVLAIDLFSSPSSLDTVRPMNRALADMFINVVDVAPALAYLDPSRFVGEMLIRSGRYWHDGLDTGALIETGKEVSNDVWGKDKPLTPLEYDMLLSIKDTHAEEHFKNIAAMPATRIKPVITYFGTLPPAYDTKVNDSAAAQQFFTAANDNNLVCFRYLVPGLVHGVPEVSIDQYNRVFNQAAPGIQAALSRQAEIALLATLKQSRPHDIIDKY